MFTVFLWGGAKVRRALSPAPRGECNRQPVPRRQPPHILQLLKRFAALPWCHREQLRHRAPCEAECFVIDRVDDASTWATVPAQRRRWRFAKHCPVVDCKPAQLIEAVSERHFRYCCVYAHLLQFTSNFCQA